MNEFKLSVTPDEDVSAILPSYFMYKATVGVSVMTAEQMETQNIDPPTYINENNPGWSSSLISPYCLKIYLQVLYMLSNLYLTVKVQYQ